MLLAMPNGKRTCDPPALTDDDVLEVLDWRPDSPAWRAEWMVLHENGPADGWRSPSPAWIDWARRALGHVPVDRDVSRVVARLLYLAETLHPHGMDRQRLQDALLALGSLHGRDYQPAEGRVALAQDQGVIRMERLDLWRPGMASGSGWRTYCRLTLHGRSLVETDPMPEPFPETPSEPAWGKPAAPPAISWLERVRHASPGKPAPRQPEPEGPEPSAGSIPHDFSWTAPFVDQQVRKFFRKHKDEYARSVKDVINEKLSIEQFGLNFGPARISAWINATLGVSEEHPNPCSKQNINGSATYDTLVKAFKRNPDEHAVVQRLQQGRSEEAQAILDALLGAGAPGRTMS